MKFFYSAFILFATYFLNADPKAVNNRILSPEESLNYMQVAEGFEVEVIASEPLIINPVICRFDFKGNLWVVEMVNYMPDTRGTGELEPVGRISVLQDKNGDGRMDSKIVCLDKLIEPRTLNFYKNGIVWADYKQLYFTELDQNFRPLKTTIIDKKYAPTGNVEHKPNEMLRGIDNWFYNAKSSYRYREIQGRWVKEKTSFRGQWGLSQDEEGRLYHNQQNTFVRADIFTPNFFLRNKELNLNINQLNTRPNRVMLNCFNMRIIGNDVFTIRENTDTRDGNIIPSDQLNVNKRATRATAASAPFYYMGDYFGESFKNTVFVGEPALHLVKVVKVDRSKTFPQGSLVYKDREIIASTDTRFRPVNFQIGPDGALYIVDLYHGILQHKTYMTNYLRDFVKKNKLATPNNLGRIYRLKIKGKELPQTISLTKQSDKTLLTLLDHKNAWYRFAAQHLLIDKKALSMVPYLEQIIKNKETPTAAIHALWVLEGLNKLEKKHIVAALASENESLIRQAVTASWSINCSLDKELISHLSEQLTETDYYLLQKLAVSTTPEAIKVLKNNLQKHWKKPFLIPAILSGIKDPQPLTNALENKEIKDNFQAQYKVSKDAGQPAKLPKNHLTGKDKRLFDKGEITYKNICIGCHGFKGEGMPNLGPPLAQSEWVTGSQETLATILLYGLHGKITVNGTVYDSPTPMPGLGQNPDFSDYDIANLMTFIRNNWGNKASPASSDVVKKMRQKHQGRTLPFKPEELKP